MNDQVKQFLRPLVRRFIKPPIKGLSKLWWRLSETKAVRWDSVRGHRSGEARLDPAGNEEFPQPQAIIHAHRFAKVAGPRRKISLIYNYYKKASTLFKSLESLQKQAWRLCSPSDVEVILVDDGTEGENILDQLPENVLYLWQRKYEYGICRAKNTGARVANGDYLVFLDPDIMVSPQYFDAMLEEFQRYGDRTIQCGYIEDYHFVGCPDPRLEFGVWELPNRPTRRFYQIAGGNLAISRSLYYETSGYDEDLVYGGVEDLLFGYHLSKLPGVSVLFNRNMQAWHIPHPPGGAHANPGKSWDVVRAKWPEFYDDYVVRGLR
jgi:glycosyltransferase involved in cell wall biosynthesis